jgi:hypothetical protein
VETTCRAACCGSLDCLRYAHENGCPWDAKTTSWAANAGHLDCLKYAHENGCPWNTHTTDWAADGGHLDCLKYAHENGCPWSTTTTSRAAERRQLDCLYYAYEQGCPWFPDDCPQLVVRELVTQLISRVKESTAACKIQEAWLRCYYDPEKFVCRRSLQRQYNKLTHA